MTDQDTPHYIVADVEFVAPRFPQYEFIELLGQGAMGASYRAVQRNLDREIVFKVIARRIGRDGEFAQAFTIQARLTAKLSHPNIVKVYDFGDAHEMLYLIQEYVSGMPLDQAISGSTVDLHQSLKLMMGLTEAVGYAHKNGVVHGDLQPRVIFLTENAEPKVNDFGLSMALRMRGCDSFSVLNRDYMAPEVLEGLTYGDELTDVYSLGGIFYRLLTGYRLSELAGAASQLSDCGRAVDGVLEKALSPDRSLRYQSADEFQADLLVLLDSVEAELAKKTSAVSAKFIFPDS